MLGQDLEVEGEVVAVLSERLWRVELPNGHQMLGYVSARRVSEWTGLKPGDRVILAVSPCDLSKGRIRQKR